MESSQVSFDWAKYDFSEVIVCNDFTNAVAMAYGPNMKIEVVLGHIKGMSNNSWDRTSVPQLAVRNRLINILLEEAEKENQQFCGTNFFLIFAGALLSVTQELLKSGYAVKNVIQSFRKALDKSLQVLDKLKFEIGTENTVIENVKTENTETANGNTQNGEAESVGMETVNAETQNRKKKNKKETINAETENTVTENVKTGSTETENGNTQNGEAESVVMETVNAETQNRKKKNKKNKKKKTINAETENTVTENVKTESTETVNGSTQNEEAESVVMETVNAGTQNRIAGSTGTENGGTENAEIENIVTENGETENRETVNMTGQNDFLHITDWPNFALPEYMKDFKKLTPLTAICNNDSPTKVIVYSCSVGYSQFPTNKTPKNEQRALKNFENQLNQLYYRITFAKARKGGVIITAGKFDHFARKYIEVHKLVAVTVESIFDLFRVANVFGAKVHNHMLSVPIEKNMGTIDSVFIHSINGNSIAVFSCKENIVITKDCTEGRSNTGNCIKDNKFVPGGGASEIEIARQLILHSRSCPAADQLPVQKFAFALEIIPRTLVESVKADVPEIMNRLYEAHNTGEANFGFVMEEENRVGDAIEHKLFDCFRTKHSGLNRAVDIVSRIYSELEESFDSQSIN